jgi:hypothetical protein
MQRVEIEQLKAAARHEHRLADNKAPPRRYSITNLAGEHDKWKQKGAIEEEERSKQASYVASESYQSSLLVVACCSRVVFIFFRLLQS